MKNIFKSVLLSVLVVLIIAGCTSKTNQNTNNVVSYSDTIEHIAKQVNEKEVKPVKKISFKHVKKKILQNDDKKLIKSFEDHY
jgi:type IV pilus biogenesis protein CpaD/CtpE